VPPAEALAGAPPVPGAGDEAIADRVAETGLAVVPGFINPAQARRLRAAARSIHEADGFRPAGVGRGPSFRVRPEVRCDEVCWLEAGRHGEDVTAWIARMEALRLAFNARLFLGLFGYEAHFSVYPPGAFYRTHVDRFADAPLRTLSAVLYLNQAWKPEDGGALRIYQGAAGQRPWLDVVPEAGTLVVFLSDRFPHEVLPARRRRWSLTGWFTRRP
jgi:SM-20-related protein